MLNSDFSKDSWFRPRDMALLAAKIANNPILTHRITINGTCGGVDPVYLGSKCALTGKLRSFNEQFSCPKAKTRSLRGYSVLCWSRGPNETETETKEFTRSCVDGSELSRQDNSRYTTVFCFQSQIILSVWYQIRSWNNFDLVICTFFVLFH